MTHEIGVRVSRTVLVTAKEIQFIYSDDLRFLTALGKSETKRASYVEPCGNQWAADMSPVAPGVKLGPFDTHKEAIDAEIAWLKEHRKL